MFLNISRAFSICHSLKTTSVAERSNSVIGILKLDSSVTLADDGTTPANYCTGGDIDVNLIQFPATVTLNTVVGTTGKCLRDVLTDLGFVLKNVVENSKIDN